MSTNDPDSDDDATAGGAGRESGGDGTARTDDVADRDATDVSDEPGATARTDVPAETAHRRGTDEGRAVATEETPNTVLNAVIGGVVTAVTTAFLGPFSPVVGGSVAGYLEGGETNDGLKVGAFAGLVALVPLLLFLPLLLFVVPVVGPRGGIAFLFAMVFGLSILGAYVVGFSALGGVLGAYLKRER